MLKKIANNARQFYDAVENKDETDIAGFDDFVNSIIDAINSNTSIVRVADDSRLFAAASKFLAKHGFRIKYKGNRNTDGTIMIRVFGKPPEDPGG